MIELRQGKVGDASSLSKLVFDSAPLLLPYLFGSQQQALQFIHQAMQKEDGQYSAMRHFVALQAADIVACITLWHSQLPTNFHTQTLTSLSEFLNAQQIHHLLSVNPLLISVFPAPTEQQLCIGHLAVNPSCQGLGIGKKLIAYAIKQAKKIDKKELVLDVDECNDAAISFYQGCHFQSLEKREFAPTKQTFLRMVYKLES